jgi:hypothetical protein
MRTAYFDSGDPEMYFDNPNLRWGDPSYLLEPGDPGYVPPTPSVNQTIKKKKRMKHNRFWPRRQGDQVIWLKTFSSELGTVAATLGLTTPQVTASVADCLWLAYLLESWLPGVRQWAQSGTDEVAAAETGAGNDVMVLPGWTAPTPPTGATPQLPGSLTRIFALVQAIRDNPKCTDAIATTLGIVGAAATGPDLSAVQPPLSATVTGAQVDLKSGWGGNSAYLDNIEFQKDWGDGKGFVSLTITASLTVTDTAPHPAARTAWAYRAIYRVGNRQVGIFSSPVSVGVGG